MNIWNFDNRFVNELPADRSGAEGTRQVTGAAYSFVAPAPVSTPKLLAVSQAMAQALGLNAQDLVSVDFLQAMAGNRLLPGMQSYASNYGGHQFGHWAGQLGDGRVIGLGEVINGNGQRWELQLKGAGPTPYSRHADGRAVVRSSLREFVCSEAMHYLGVPTTRALCLVGTGDRVIRDMFYDGNPQAEPGAIVCRVAPSFIRFGHFELPTSRGEIDLLQGLVEFTIDRDYPHLRGSASSMADWFIEVCERTAYLLANWMRIGFVHGVMNTDNMSILGLTIDYGPYGWLESVDPAWTPNTTDAQGRRYAFARQPQIAQWNLSCLASALAPLFDDQAPLHDGLKRYAQVFTEQQAKMQSAKLGLTGHRPEDDRLINDLYQLMHASEVDMTIFFRRLADVTVESPDLSPLAEAFYEQKKYDDKSTHWQQWLQRWSQRVATDGTPDRLRAQQMNRINPALVPRNYLTQQAIDAVEQGDLGPLNLLMQAIQSPYEELPAFAKLRKRRPDWARQRAGCSMLSCSS